MRSMPVLMPERTGAIRRRSNYFALLLGTVALTLPAQEAGLIVTVLDERTGEVQTNLRPEHFAVKDGETTLRVVSINAPRGPSDILLLVDTSMVGESVRFVADAMIEELRTNESMAVVGYHDTAELLQDFTSEKTFLRKSLQRVEYGNVPRVHDALFASIDQGFAGSASRKAIVLISAGVVGASRTPEAEVVERARAKQVSIYSVFGRGDARSLLRRFSLRTGGASFFARRLKLEPRQLARRVLQAVRHPYELTVSGVYSLGDRIAVTVADPSGSKKKLTASVRAVD